MLLVKEVGIEGGTCKGQQITELGRSNALLIHHTA